MRALFCAGWSRVRSPAVGAHILVLLLLLFVALSAGVCIRTVHAQSSRPSTSLTLLANLPQCSPKYLYAPERFDILYVSCQISLVQPAAGTPAAVVILERSSGTFIAQLNASDCRTSDGSFLW